jgi:hypothetical protein
VAKVNDTIILVRYALGKGKRAREMHAAAEWENRESAYLAARRAPSKEHD